MQPRGYAAAASVLWALACLLLGLAASLACWMAAALLRRPPRPEAPLIALLVGGLAFAAVAAWVRARLRRGESHSCR